MATYVRPMRLKQPLKLRLFVSASFTSETQGLHPSDCLSGAKPRATNKSSSTSPCGSRAKQQRY